MSVVQGVAAAVAAIVLFLFALQGFSREIQSTGGAALRGWLGRLTENRWQAFLVGAIATATAQSSSAVTSLAVSLVEAGAISFQGSLGVLLGANVGTTATAWLVSFKISGLGSIFIVLGAVVSALPGRFNLAGKAIFYFGLIFFALDLLALELRPLQQLPQFQGWLGRASAPWLGVLAGLGFTAVVQSSSVTTGLAILLVHQGILPVPAAIPIVVGANVGSTSTALLASLSLGPTARATAMANAGFNLVGLVLFFPFLEAFSAFVVSLTKAPATAVALAHTLFNVSMALPLLLSLKSTGPWLHRRLLPGESASGLRRR